MSSEPEGPVFDNYTRPVDPPVDPQLINNVGTVHLDPVRKSSELDECSLSHR